MAETRFREDKYSWLMHRLVYEWNFGIDVIVSGEYPYWFVEDLAAMWKERESDVDVTLEDWVNLLVDEGWKIECNDRAEAHKEEA